MARYSAEVIALAYARDYLHALRLDLEDRFGRFPLSLEPWEAAMKRIENAIDAARPPHGRKGGELAMDATTLRKACEYLNADLRLHGVHTYTVDPGKLEAALDAAHPEES